MSFWSGKRVFVTGHTGFKGTWLSLWLEKLGAEVYGYSLPHDDVRDQPIIEQSIWMVKPDVVFHLAAQALVLRSYADPQETFSTNVLGTVNVLEAVRKTPGVQATVVVTSDKCYEDTEQPCKEGDRLGGHDPYSSSKACAELVTQAYRKSFGLNVATVRAGNVIGGGDWSEGRLIPDLARAAKERRMLLVRKPDAVRPWQHVLDPLSGYLKLAHAMSVYPEGRYAEAWNFGPDVCQPVRWVASEFRRHWGDSSGWTTGEVEQQHEAAVLRLDSSKAKARLVWTPVWGVAQAVERAVDWYKADTTGADMKAFTLEQIGDFERA